MPKPSSLLTHLWIELAALALAGAGFWLVPEDPALPALLLTAAALPLMLLSWLVLWIAERPGVPWCQCPLVPGTWSLVFFPRYLVPIKQSVAPA